MGATSSRPARSRSAPPAAASAAADGDAFNPPTRSRPWPEGAATRLTVDVDPVGMKSTAAESSWTSMPSAQVALGVGPRFWRIDRPNVGGVQQHDACLGGSTARYSPRSIRRSGSAAGRPVDPGRSLSTIAKVSHASRSRPGSACSASSNAARIRLRTGRRRRAIHDPGDDRSRSSCPSTMVRAAATIGVSSELDRFGPGACTYRPEVEPLHVREQHTDQGRDGGEEAAERRGDSTGRENPVVTW